MDKSQTLNLHSLPLLPAPQYAFGLQANAPEHELGSASLLPAGAEIPYGPPVEIVPGWSFPPVRLHSMPSGDHEMRCGGLDRAGIGRFLFGEVGQHMRP